MYTGTEKPFIKYNCNDNMIISIFNTLYFGRYFRKKANILAYF
jgi:hypothetical protein